MVHYRCSRAAVISRLGSPDAADRVKHPVSAGSPKVRSSLGRRLPRGFGMGSVGQGGAVSPSKTRSASSPFSRRTALSELLKIRVSFPNQSRAAFAILPVPIVVVLRHRRIPVPCWVDPSRGADKVEHAGSGGGDLLGHFGGCGVIENCLPRPVDGQERPVSKNRILCVRVIRSLRVRVTRPESDRFAALVRRTRNRDLRSAVAVSRWKFAGVLSVRLHWNQAKPRRHFAQVLNDCEKSG